MPTLSLDRQEAYRRRYAAIRPGWRPSTHVYQDLVADRLTPTSRVLDLGCGRGGVLERLHRRAGFVAGVDSDMPSLHRHRSPALALAAARAEALPCRDGAFDVIASSWVLEHLSHPESAFSEIARVLDSGGRFLFLTPNARHPLISLSRKRAATAVTRLYDREQADIFPALYRANTSARIRQLAQGAGLRCVSLRQVGDPTYLAFSEPLFWLGCLIERVIPSEFRLHLVGEFVAS